MNARAKAILEGYFERLLDADGLPAAQSGVKVVIAKGIEHVIRAPQTESPGVRLVLSAVRHGRQQALVELMAGNVQEGVKTRRGGYLAAVDCGQGASRCRFLPDVFLPDTPESAARWRTFLGRLAPDSRLGRDPQSGLSGRIPYRDGTWLSDLTFAPGEPLAIIPEVTRVNGNLSVSTASLATGHSVEVRGSLTAPAGLLATTPAPITRLGGELRLLDETQSPEDLALTPGQLLAWGLRPGRCLWLGPRRLRFMSEGEGRATTFLLRPILAAGARPPEPPVSFDGQAWHRLELALPPGTRRRLAELMRNLRERLGLPAGLVSDDPGRIIEAASRARGFLELLARARHAGRAAIGETDRAFLARLGADLAALAEAAAFTGRETPQDLGAKAEAAQRLIAGFDPERLAAAGALSVKPRDPLDAAALANDLEYLTILGQDTLNVDDVLRTAGRTLVFLNNVLSSKEAKARGRRPGRRGARRGQEAHRGRGRRGRPGRAPEGRGLGHHRSAPGAARARPGPGAAQPAPEDLKPQAAERDHRRFPHRPLHQRQRRAGPGPPLPHSPGRVHDGQPGRHVHGRGLARRRGFQPAGPGQRPVGQPAVPAEKRAQARQRAARRQPAPGSRGRTGRTGPRAHPAPGRLQRRQHQDRRLARTPKDGPKVMPHSAFDGTACRLQRALALGLLLCLGLGASARAADLTVWSALPKAEFAPVLEAYRTASGQEANLVEAPFPELLARYLATPAAAKPDLLLGASVQDLASAAAAGLLDVLDPPGPAAALPEMWRDPGRRWLALAYRPLGLVYAAERVNPESLNSYEALAENRWKGRLALPSGRDPGLLTLAGFFKARYGAANAQALLAAYAANLARPAAGGPQEAIATVDAGAADVALADAPALARYLSAHPKSRLAVFWPNQHAEGAPGHGRRRRPAERRAPSRGRGEAHVLARLRGRPESARGRDHGLSGAGRRAGGAAADLVRRLPPEPGAGGNLRPARARGHCPAGQGRSRQVGVLTALTLRPAARTSWSGGFSFMPACTATGQRPRRNAGA